MIKRTGGGRNERGITGLETAIVLIAFAALSTGMFSADKVVITPTAAEMKAQQDSVRLINLEERGFKVTTAQEGEDVEDLLELLGMLGIDVPEFGVVEILTLKTEVVE